MCMLRLSGGDCEIFIRARLGFFFSAVSADNLRLYQGDETRVANRSKRACKSFVTYIGCMTHTTGKYKLHQVIKCHVRAYKSIKLCTRILITFSYRSFLYGSISVILTKMVATTRNRGRFTSL